jgi:hypothetical protein
MNTTTLQVGTKIEVIEDIDLEPHTTVNVGERGVVVRVTPQETDILLERYHPGLARWGNTMWIFPEHGADDEVLSKIRNIGQIIDSLGSLTEGYFTLSEVSALLR